MQTVRRNIVYLDDHSIIADAVCMAIDAAQINFLFQVFHHADDAMHYIETSLKYNTRIDLIISDHNHPGKKGLDFAVDVKERTYSYGKFIPFLLLSMVVPQPLNRFTKTSFLDKMQHSKKPFIVEEYQRYTTFINHLESGYIQSYLGKNEAPKIIVHEVMRLSAHRPLF